MSTKVSKGQLIELLTARGKRRQAQNEDLQKRMYQLFGRQAEPEHPITTLVKGKINDAMAALTADRLYAADRSVPLFSSNDAVNLVPMIIDEMCKSEPNLDFDAEERQMFERFLRSMLRGIGDAFLGMVPSDKDPYDAYYNWIATVLDVVNEQGKSPGDIILSQDGNDEISRRLYSKSQFTELGKVDLEKMINPDTMKQAIILPMTEALIAEIDDEDEREEIRRKMAAKIDPELQEMCDKMLRVASEWFAEETARIYAA